MRLLIVEDEYNLLEALVRGLKREGYAIDAASDGEEALAFAEINEYDLVVLDINLPELNGFSVLETLRKQNQETRVIIVSANRTIEDRVRGLDLGANDYLIKPFDFSELKARIRALLRRDFVSKPNLIRDSELEIDLSLKQVSYMGHPVVLTLKEYAILKYLVENKNRVISADELYQRIWNDDANPFTDVMRVHIYSLRKKLKMATGKGEMIKTVKGAGYLFVSEEGH